MRTGLLFEPQKAEKMKRLTLNEFLVDDFRERQRSEHELVGTADKTNQ